MGSQAGHVGLTSVNGSPMDIEKHLESTHYESSYNEIQEHNIVRKIDLRVVPVLCVLYLLAFLDRVDIANASLFGLKKDLRLRGDQYNTALVIFFVPYILFRSHRILFSKDSNLTFVSGCMFMFGLTGCLQGLTQGYSGLLAARFFLDAFESAVFPGSFYLLSMWYRREESQKRFTFFFSSTTLGGAFGRLLASAIGKMDGVRGFRGWRWVFIIEGVLTCVISILFFFLIADFPEEVTWLIAEEKELVKRRLYDDVGHSQIDEKLTTRSVLQVIKDYKVIVGGFMYFGLVVSSYGYSYFTPAIIQAFGHGNIRTQLLSVPPWAAAFVFAMTIAILSDYFKHRYIFTLIPTALSSTGFTILLIVHNNKRDMVRYASYLAGHRRRAVATGWQIGFGNIGGIIAAYAFLAKEAPKYTAGYTICVTCIVVSAISCVMYLIGISWENCPRDRGNVYGTELSSEEKQRLGDLNPDYRYGL